MKIIDRFLFLLKILCYERAKNLQKEIFLKKHEKKVFI